MNMNGLVPKSAAWCRYCVGEKKPCPDHRTGEYSGSNLYEPTAWVLEVVDKHYSAWDGRIYHCFGYDPRCGFWMRTVDEPVRETNVSERAIGRTFHVVQRKVG